MYTPVAPPKKSKTLLIVAVVVVVAIVIIAAAALSLGGDTEGASGSNNNDNNNDATNNSNTTNPTTPTQIANVSMSGTGDKVSEKFELQAGVTIFHMTHSGSANFIVTLYNDTGEYVELLANEIGSYDGSTLIGVKVGNTLFAEPGKHYMQVEADGAWNIIVEQPRVSSGSAVPLTLTGSGPQASTPINLQSGVVLVNMTHTGSSNFAVVLWADNGDYVDLLANEIGVYSGEKAVTVNGGLFNPSPGIHWLDIDADGSWTIKITKM
jgi:hypothetical protein